MPAAAVIPAPIAYIKVVAVKKLVVEFLECERCQLFRVCRVVFAFFCYLLVSHLLGWSIRYCYFEKIRVFQAGLP